MPPTAEDGERSDLAAPGLSLTAGRRRGAGGGGGARTSRQPSREEGASAIGEASLGSLGGEGARGGTSPFVRIVNISKYFELRAKTCGVTPTVPPCSLVIRISSSWLVGVLRGVNPGGEALIRL